MPAELFEQLTNVRLRQSLRSQMCPCCGGIKVPKQTFCRNCYYRLTPHIRKNLYRLIGEGYAQAVEAAMRHLVADVFRVPGNEQADANSQPPTHPKEDRS